MINNLVAGEVAAVSIELHTAMIQEKDIDWPNKNRYSLFNGLSGWWDFCGNAGLAFAKIILDDTEHYEEIEDYYCTILDTYVESIWNFINSKNKLSYPNPEQLNQMVINAVRSI